MLSLWGYGLSPSDDQVFFFRFKTYIRVREFYGDYRRQADAKCNARKFSTGRQDIFISLPWCHYYCRFSSRFRWRFIVAAIDDAPMITGDYFWLLRFARWEWWREHFVFILERSRPRIALGQLQSARFPYHADDKAFQLAKYDSPLTLHFQFEHTLILGWWRYICLAT